jgi:AraC-like DNA-binding protein
MTPYQFILRTRLHRAAVRLVQSNDKISTIALDAGFNDLSTFNRRFRLVMGASPRAYRTSGGSWFVKALACRSEAFEQGLRKFRKY